MQKQHYHSLSVEMQWNKAQWNLNPLIQCIQKQLNSSGRKGGDDLGGSLCLCKHAHPHYHIIP